MGVVEISKSIQGLKLNQPLAVYFHIICIVSGKQNKVTFNNVCYIFQIHLYF